MSTSNVGLTLPTPTATVVAKADEDSCSLWSQPGTLCEDLADPEVVPELFGRVV